LLTSLENYKTKSEMKRLKEERYLTRSRMRYLKKLMILIMNFIKKNSKEKLE